MTPHDQPALPTQARALLCATEPTDQGILGAELQRADVILADGELPFVTSEELERRYGVALPPSLRALWRLADEHMIERAKLDGFRYVRMAPGGWEPPATTNEPPYFRATLQRFEWNTFSNMQFLERLSGLAPLGWDEGDNRFEVATVHPDAPVFWLDHETADLLDAGCVAHSLRDFLRAKSGDVAGLSPAEIALIRDGSRWTRDTDGHAYLPRRGPLRQWPPFLWARHAWIVAELAFGSTEGQLERPEVLVFDFETEAGLLEQSEPLALYWLLRALLLDEPSTLAEVLRRTQRHPSPLVGAMARFVRETPTLRAESLFGKARSRAAAYRDRLRMAEGFDAAAF